MLRDRSAPGDDPEVNRPDFSYRVAAALIGNASGHVIAQACQLKGIVADTGK
jgi:hypothetical protein